MSEKRLPSVEQARRSLRLSGDQFANTPLEPTDLGTIYIHPRKGIRQAAADNRILSATGTFYANESLLARTLKQRGAHVQPRSIVLRVLRGLRESTIWGISGFASSGFSCKAEDEILDRFYGCLASQNKPAMVCDGGASCGVLGLSGVLAKKHGLPTLGVTPLQGIASMAPRDHMIIYGDLYPEREELVGTLPDVLVCPGGGEGAMRECMAALKHGGHVLLLMLTPAACSSMRNWPSLPKMQQAGDRKQLVICNAIEDLPQSIAAITADANKSRQARLSVIANMFNARS